MPLEDLIRLLHAAPFEPFRIYVTDGAHYDIRHRELCMPGARSIAIGIRDTTLSHIVYERLVQVALVHITRLEPLPVTHGGNGQAGA
jgi:hypothetical protein